MSTIQFEDEFGVHTHTSAGPPYDHKKKITCVACINFQIELYYELCVQYGWTRWPLGYDAVDLTV